MPPNAAQCPCSLANQGRDTCPIRFVPHARKYSGFIGTNAKSVVAPTGHAGVRMFSRSGSRGPFGRTWPKPKVAARGMGRLVPISA